MTTTNTITSTLNINANASETVAAVLAVPFSNRRDVAAAVKAGYTEWASKQLYACADVCGWSDSDRAEIENIADHVAYRLSSDAIDMRAQLGA